MAFNVPISPLPSVTSPSDWVRPSDWPVITDTANEVQFLVADVNLKAFAITTTFTRTSGNIYIDWGDGVIDTISTTTATTTNHVYSTGGTPCSRGYNTFKIRIYGDATCVITNARHVANFAVTGGAPYYNNGLLEAYFGDNTCNTTAFLNPYFGSSGGTSSVASFGYLEYVKLPAVVAWTTQFQYMFTNCNNLYKVVMPTSASSATNMVALFQGCINLLDVVIPSDATGVTNMSSTFQACENLRTVSLPTSLDSCTTFSTMFGVCNSLKNVTMPSMNSATVLNTMFTNCNSLEWVKFTSLPSPASPATAISMTQTFYQCYHLQYVFFPNTCSSNAIYSLGSGTFSSCASLRSLVFPTNFNASTLATAFSGCYSMTSIIFQSGMSALTDLSSAFNACYSLVNITLPTTVSSSGVNLSAAFAYCTSLTSITIPSGWLITNLSQTFQYSNNLKTIVLPNNAQNSVTSMASMCIANYKLESITLPTSLTGVTSLANTFQYAYALKDCVLPSTMNSVTTMTTCFYANYNLLTVTLPTSMSACTNFSSAFYNCTQLKSIVMPSTVSASTTTFDSAFRLCTNLTTLTLPTTQMSALTTAASFINNVGSLSTISNTSKLGSLTATPLVSFATNTLANGITALSFSCPMSVLTINGASATNFNKLASLRLLNTNTGQWTGTSPQINISYCDMSTAALNTLFADIAAQGTVTSKTINITGCTGAAGLSAANRLVITSKGWTITG